MSGWFGSPPERKRGDGDDFVATVCLAAAGVAIALYVFLRALGGEALGGLAAGAGGGVVLGCVAARLDEPAGHWAGAALLAGLAASGAYALADPATPAPSSYALALWLAAGAALLAAGPAILAGERLQLDLWRSRMRAEEKRRLREGMDRDAREWRDRRRQEGRASAAERRR